MAFNIKITKKLHTKPQESKALIFPLGAVTTEIFSLALYIFQIFWLNLKSDRLLHNNIYVALVNRV